MGRELSPNQEGKSVRRQSSSEAGAPGRLAVCAFIQGSWAGLAEGSTEQLLRSESRVPDTPQDKGHGESWESGISRSRPGRPL